MAVAGDSAGGNLAAATAQALRGRTGLRHQVLIYPVTRGQAGGTDSYRRYGEGHYLTARDMQYFLDSYAPGAAPDDPRLVPSAATDLSGLAPATFVIAECDPLRDDGRSYAAALEAAGVEVTVRQFDGQVHPFVFPRGLKRRPPHRPGLHRAAAARSVPLTGTTARRAAAGATGSVPHGLGPGRARAAVVTTTHDLGSSSRAPGSCSLTASGPVRAARAVHR